MCCSENKNNKQKYSLQILDLFTWQKLKHGPAVHLNTWSVYLEWTGQGIVHEHVSCLTYRFFINDVIFYFILKCCFIATKTGIEPIIQGVYKLLHQDVV
jgi:hypothetical protein